MNITATLPDHGAIVEAILEGFVIAAAQMIATGVVPPFPWLTPVKYVKEPEGAERWLLPNQTLETGKGDCEDLAIWTAAGYRVTGQDPGAYVTLRMTGAREVHAVVGLSDGRVVDPSLQMKTAERMAVRGVPDYVMSLGDVLVREHRGDGQRKPGTATLPPAAPTKAPMRNPLAKAYADAARSPTSTSTRDVAKAVNAELQRTREFERATREPVRAADVANPGGGSNLIVDPDTGIVRHPSKQEGQLPVDPSTGVPIGLDPVTGLPYGQYPPYGYPPYGYPSYPYGYPSTPYGGGGGDYAEMLYQQYMQATPTLDFDVNQWPTYQELYGEELPPALDDGAADVEEASTSYIDVDEASPEELA